MLTINIGKHFSNKWINFTLASEYFIFPIRKKYVRWRHMMIRIQIDYFYWITVRCRQFKLQVKFFLAFLFTWFDRTRAADHENLLLSLSKYFLPVEKYEILEGCRLSRKTHLLQKCAKFPTLFAFLVSENHFFRFSIKNWVWKSY
jgi:hypothetical protein